MDRRSFISRTAKVSAAAVAGFSLANSSNIIANSLPQETNYDLIAVKGGEPDVMFDKAIESLGGMGKFVKPGQKVVVKPNIGWNTSPERAANTHPALIKRVIEHCKNAGASDVYVFDHTCDDWQKCYENSGIEEAVKSAGGKMVPGNSEKYYREVEVKQGKRLTKATVHELILDSDVFINIPVLKHHSSTKLSIAMKNLMGNVWDRGFWHRNDLHQCIADFASFRKPDLNIIDAYNVMKKNGPRGVSTADLVKYKSLIVSPDIVAADAAAAKLFGHNETDIDYIKFANEMGLGTMDLTKLSIKRIKV